MSSFAAETVIPGRPAPGNATRPRRRRAWQLGAVVLLGLAIRLFQLGGPSLWNDELYSRFYYDLFGPGFLLGQGLRLEPTPPTYYFLLQGWMALFGASEAALRSLSVAASVAAIPLVYLLARGLLSARAAILSALLFALCPLGVMFAQEARVYALLLIPYAAAMIGASRFLARPERTGALALYAAGAVAAAYCHLTMVIVMAGLGLAGLAHLLLGRLGWRSPALRRWVAANAVVGALILLELWRMHAGGGTRPALSWMPPLSLRDLAVALSSVTTNSVVPMRWPGAELGLLLLAALALCLLLCGLPPAARTILVAAPALGFALMVLASLRQPVLLPRTVLWLTVPLCVLLAHALSARSAARPFLAAITVLAFGAGLVWQFALTDGANKTPWRRLFAQDGAAMRAADLVVFGTQATPLAAAYYLPGLAHLAQWRGPMPPSIEATMIPARLGVPAIQAPQVAAAIRRGEHVWVVAQWGDVARLPGLLAQVRPPSRRIDDFCGGRTPCLSALEWNRAAPQAAPG